jgi:hypothetical protein
MSLPARCVDLTAEQVRDGLESMAAMRRLLEHMARVARPAEGAPKILVPIGRMASSACGWVDAGLRVEISGDSKRTQILIATDMGAEVRELMFPRLVFGVGWNEFAHATKVAPKLVAPMKVRTKDGIIILTCEVEIVGTVAPPAFGISEASLRKSLPAALRRSLPPILDPARRVKTESPGPSEAVIARIVPKAPRAPAIDELSKPDEEWDVGVYSSTMKTRETKPPAEPRALSTAPTRPPSDPTKGQEASRASKTRRTSKAPARASKAPRASKVPRASKAPSGSKRAPNIASKRKVPVLRRTSKAPTKPASPPTTKQRPYRPAAAQADTKEPPRRATEATPSDSGGEANPSPRPRPKIRRREA